MAERRGLLRGVHLSLVQHKALEILHLIDEIEKIQNKFLQFRLALVSSGVYKAEAVFPEYSEVLGEKKDVVEIDDPRADDPTAEFDYSAVEWKGSEAQAEYEEIMKTISSLQTGTIQGKELVSYPGQGEWR